MSIKRVQRLMREAGIRSIVVKKYRLIPSKEQVMERKKYLYNLKRIHGSICYNPSQEMEDMIRSKQVA